MNQNQYREIAKEDRTRTIIYITVYFAIVIIGAFFLLLTYWYIWLILDLVGLFLLIRWHTRNFAYHCPRCGYEFEISVFTNFLSPHGVSKSGGWKYLKCPKCHETSRTTIMKKVKNLQIKIG